MVAAAAAMVGVFLLLGMEAVVPRHSGTPARVRELPLQVTIQSPQPFFMQSVGQGPSLSGNRVVWTATRGEGQTGSQADRIFAYDLASGQLSVPVHTRYGSTGFIGSYTLAGTELAYVDTGFEPGGIFSWRLSLVNLRTGWSETIATSAPDDTMGLPPQIAFDGVHLLVLQTSDLGGGHHDSVATLFTPAQHRRQVLERLRDVLFLDPALARSAAFWTVDSFGSHASSRLMAYDLAQRTLRLIPVGDVSQLAASGDLLVWKSGMSGVNGHIGLYSVSQRRVLDRDLAHGDRAIFPSIDGRMVAWTDRDGLSIQVYSLSSGRVIYSTPAAIRNTGALCTHCYGLTSVSGHAASWAYTVLATHNGTTRGYVVVRQIR